MIRWIRATTSVRVPAVPGSCRSCVALTSPSHRLALVKPCWRLEHGQGSSMVRECADRPDAGDIGPTGNANAIHADTARNRSARHLRDRARRRPGRTRGFCTRKSSVARPGARCLEPSGASCAPPGVRRRRRRLDPNGRYDVSRRGRRHDQGPAQGIAQGAARAVGDWPMGEEYLHRLPVRVVQCCRGRDLEAPRRYGQTDDRELAAPVRSGFIIADNHASCRRTAGFIVRSSHRGRSGERATGSAPGRSRASSGRLFGGIHTVRAIDGARSCHDGATNRATQSQH